MDTQTKIANGLQKTRRLYLDCKVTQQTPYVLQIIQELLLQQLGPRAYDIDQGVSGEYLAAVFCSLPNTKGQDGWCLHAWNSEYWIWIWNSVAGGTIYTVTKVGEKPVGTGGYTRLGSVLSLKCINYEFLEFYKGGL